MITAAGIVGSQAKIALGKVVSNILAMIDQIINSPDIDPAKVASWIRYGDFCISKIAGTYSKTEIPNVATAAIQRAPILRRNVAFGTLATKRPPTHNDKPPKRIQHTKKNRKSRMFHIKLYFAANKTIATSLGYNDKIQQISKEVYYSN